MRWLTLVVCVIVSATVAPFARPAYAADSAKKKAIAASILARAALDEGKFGKCADLYREAWMADPATLGYLYSVARCEHKGGRFDAAVRDYEELLKVVGEKPNPMAIKSKKFLTEARAQLAEQKKHEAELLDKARKQAEEDKRKALAAEKAKAAGANAAKSAPVVTKPAGRDGTLQRSLGWVAIGAGIVMAGTAGGLYLVAGSDRKALDGRLDDLKTGKDQKFTQKQARAQADDIAQQKTIAAVIGAASFAAIGGGAYLLYAAPQRTAWTPLVVPTQGGGLVGATIRF